MKHEDAQALFTAYYDGELDDARIVKLEEHLERCEHCSTEWSAYRRTMADVSGLLAASPPVDTTRKVEHIIRRRSRGRFFGKTRSRPPFAVVSFVVVLFFFLAYLMLIALGEVSLLQPNDDDGHLEDSSGEK